MHFKSMINDYIAGLDFIFKRVRPFSFYKGHFYLEEAKQKPKSI